MSNETLEYQCLVKQRDQLIDNISKFNSVMHSLSFTIITLIAGLSVLNKDIKLTEISAFFISQFFILTELFVLGLFFAANNDRDYIKAIDDYLAKQYGVNVLLFQGHLGNKHVRAWTSKFALLMFALSVISAITIGIFFATILIPILFDNLLFLIIMSVETVIVLIFIFLNIIDKFMEGKKGTKIYREAHRFLFSNFK